MEFPFVILGILIWSSHLWYLDFWYGVPICDTWNFDMEFPVVILLIWSSHSWYLDFWYGVPICDTWNLIWSSHLNILGIFDLGRLGGAPICDTFWCFGRKHLWYLDLSIWKLDLWFFDFPYVILGTVQTMVGTYDMSLKHQTVRKKIGEAPSSRIYIRMTTFSPRTSSCNSEIELGRCAFTQPATDSHP